jgi:HSP20 family protein
MGRNDYRIEKRFEEMHERANRIFEEMWEMSRPVLMMPDYVWKPALDIYETDDEVIVLVEIAGMKKEEIEVAMQGNILIISGNRTENIPYKKKLEQMEINYGRFQRIVKIFAPIEREKIIATYENGILKIRLPKGKEIQQPIRVTYDKQGQKSD